MLRILLFLILTLNAVLSIAQSATLRGSVIKYDTKESIPGVVVRLSDDIGTTTDMSGQYTLTAPTGSYTIVFSLVGYEEHKQQIQLIANQSTELNVSLKEANNSIDVVVVSAGKFEQKLGEVTMSMEVLNPELVQEKNAITADEALQQSPGVSIVDGEPQIRSGSGYSFGAGSRVQILVDDLPVLSGDAGRPSWGFMPLENLSQIEIIKGASSVLYGSAALSGAINFRTAFPSDTAKTVVTMYCGVYSNPKSDSSKYWSSNLMRTGVNFLHSQKIGQMDLVVGGSYLGDDGHLGPIKDTATGAFDNKFNPFTSDRYSSTNRIRVNMNLRYRSKKIDGLAYGVNTNWTQGNSLATLLWENSKTGLYG
jgi:outer membrane receptor protein involved in Fe transport